MCISRTVDFSALTIKGRNEERPPEEKVSASAVPVAATAMSPITLEQYLDCLDPALVTGTMLFSFFQSTRATKHHFNIKDMTELMNPKVKRVLFRLHKPQGTTDHHLVPPTSCKVNRRRLDHSSWGCSKTCERSYLSQIHQRKRHCLLARGSSPA